MGRRTTGTDGLRLPARLLICSQGRRVRGGGHRRAADRKPHEGIQADADRHTNVQQ